MMQPTSFRFELVEQVGVITFTRPDTLNSLTFAVYRELTDLLLALEKENSVRAVVITGEGRGFCSGGDHHDIIKPLLTRDMPALLEFTRMTCDLIRNLRALRKPVVAALNGTAAGAGAVIALASRSPAVTSATRPVAPAAGRGPAAMPVEPTPHPGQPRLVPAEHYGPGAQVTVINHPPVQRWSPALAAVLSVLVPGLGQAYKGQVLNGIVWFFLVGVGYLALVLPGLLLHFFCNVGAASGNPWTPGRTEVVRR
jgi:hypothetical protein